MNLVDYWVLETFYYMSFFYMAWMGIYNALLKFLYVVQIDINIDRLFLAAKAWNREVSSADLCTVDITKRC